MTVEEEDEAIERQEVVFLMDGDKHTAKKNYRNVRASRLVAGAEENISALSNAGSRLGRPGVGSKVVAKRKPGMRGWDGGNT